MQYISSIGENNYKANSIFKMNDLGKEVTTFSDSVVISYDVDFKSGGFHVIMDLIYISLDLLNVGVLIRGGLTFGKLIHKNNICFGPAMVEAYNIESKYAKFPRILVSRKVYEANIKNSICIHSAEEESGYLNNILTKAENDYYFIDYLKQCGEFEEGKYLSILANVRDMIVSQLNSSNDENVLQKYKWFG